MTDGSATTLARRARLHAALGEPARLGIVDALVLGDASPGELGARIGLATNLLAFHLGVLEDAGLIRRVRSEGDRRRTYVQLRWEDPDVAGLVPPATLSAVPRVVFVCTANSARSQLAAALWRTVSRVPAASAGTAPGPGVHPRAVEVGRRHGLRLGRARTHHVDDVVRPEDLVVAVCDRAHEHFVPPAAGRRHPEPRQPLHWAVPDPVAADTDEAFEVAYLDLTHRIDRLSAAVEP